MRTVSLEYAQNDLLALFGGISVVVLIGNMEDELRTNSADSNGFDFLNVDFAADGYVQSRLYSSPLGCTPPWWSP